MDNSSSQKQTAAEVVNKTSKTPGLRYKLIDARRYNFLTYQDLLTGKKYCVHALELAASAQLINGFCPWDARQIGVIAGQASYDPPPPADPFAL